MYPSEAYSGYKWVFTPDMIPNSRKLHNVPSDALIKEYEEKLLKHTIDYLYKNEKAFQALLKKSGELGNEFTPAERLKFLNELKGELADVKFFEITKFEHIVRKND